MPQQKSSDGIETKIEVARHEKLKKRTVPETQKIKKIKKHPAQVLRSRSPVQVCLRAWPSVNADPKYLVTVALSRLHFQGLAKKLGIVTSY